MIDINTLSAHLQTVQIYKQTILQGQFKGQDSSVVMSMVNYFNDIQRQLEEQLSSLNNSDENKLPESE